MATQTLEQAIHLAKSGKSHELRSAAVALEGLPVGGWGETEQARREGVLGQLPLRSQRSYTIDQFISAVYTVDQADRYRSTVTG